MYFDGDAKFQRTWRLVRQKKTRNSAIADKPFDAFRGQSRSQNMVPFHMLGMVPY